MDWEKIKEALRKYLTNKYLLTLLIFAVIFVFVGDQSLIHRLKRAHSIHETERQVRSLREQSAQAAHQLKVLQNTDSLERFARETYYMHTPDEVVYKVDEQ